MAAPDGVHDKPIIWCKQQRAPLLKQWCPVAQIPVGAHPCLQVGMWQAPEERVRGVRAEQHAGDDGHIQLHRAHGDERVCVLPDAALHAGHDRRHLRRPAHLDHPGARCARLLSKVLLPLTRHQGANAFCYYLAVTPREPTWGPRLRAALVFSSTGALANQIERVLRDGNSPAGAGTRGSAHAQP